MNRIHAGGYSSRFYLCKVCETIREDTVRNDGTITGTRWHHLDSTVLPEAVIQQARALLDQPYYGQLSLFGEGNQD